MTKIAIFVEGSGEALFLWHLSQHIFADKNATFVTWVQNGGRRFPRSAMDEKREVSGTGEDFYIQIVNSANQDRVVSDAIDKEAGLVEAGFEKVFVIRDVAPDFKRTDIDKLRDGLATTLSNYKIPMSILLEIMEFESWLLAMADFFHRMDARLSAEAIAAKIGLMPCSENCQNFDRPSDKFKDIMEIAEITEPKSKAVVQSILNTFDFVVLVNERAANVNDLNTLIMEMTST